MKKICLLTTLVSGMATAMANPVDVQASARANSYTIQMNQPLLTQGLHEYVIENNTDEEKLFFVIYENCIETMYFCAGGQKRVEINANNFDADTTTSSLQFLPPQGWVPGDHKITVSTEIYESVKQDSGSDVRVLLQSDVSYGNLHIK